MLNCGILIYPRFIFLLRKRSIVNEMLKNLTRNSKLNTLFLIILVSFILILVLTLFHAAPIGPAINVLKNETKQAANATKLNTTINGTISPGGYIFTTSLDSQQQNTRWKAYVGNVTGTLVLDDASSNTLFSWSLSTVTGEVYATRASGNINWTGINCTWIADGRDNKTWDMINYSVSNRTPEHNENEALSHTNKDDNITATFATTSTNHSSITIGSVVIGEDECFTLQTYQKDAAQTFADSTDANFTEIILYDGAYNRSNGNVVYATIVEQNDKDYDSADTYDFQMIVPESGAVGFSGSTAYYF